MEVTEAVDSSVRRRVAVAARGLTRRAVRRVRGPSPWGPDTAAFAADAVEGPTTVLFRRLRAIPGWFNIDDCAHFTLVLNLQRALGVSGDLLEIGSYHGRSTAVMASLLAPDERLVVVDAFELDTVEPYAERPTPDRLVDNIRRVVPHFDRSRLDIRAAHSSEAALTGTRGFRFCHIDGGHERDAALNDLLLCAERTVVGGVIAIDDVGHPRFPGPGQALEEFLARCSEFEVLADLNRHGARGRKTYVQRTPADR